jgi:hypothetical protein
MSRGKRGLTLQELEIQSEHEREAAMKDVDVEVGRTGVVVDTTSLGTELTIMVDENQFERTSIDVSEENLPDLLAALGHALEQSADSSLLELAGTLVQQAADLVKEHQATAEVV